MKFTTLLLLSLVLLGLSGCDNMRSGTSEQSAAPSTRAKSELGKPEVDATNNLAKSQPAAAQENVSLNQADAANTASQAIERKIIRNANLTLEVTSPADNQRKITSIAESHQGFVVTSEATQSTTDDKAKPEVTINLVVRVPAAQFNQVMEEIRATATRVLQEKITGQDVTEEFIDLEARIKNQKALEAQFIEIMKRAGKVEDALEVQRQLADVRTEIEKLEGRKRFLENQASLSTISITLQSPTQIVNAAGFWYSIRSAFADGVDVAAAIIFFLIRAIIALLPLLILIVLPFGLIARLVSRRIRSQRLARQREEDVEAAT
jgi:Domain of unknown function (DUF4349)